MFGTLRLILAILVVAAHCELSQQINLGVSAVVVFFLLSGFVMTATIRRYYGHWKRYGSFMLDRANRIFPQYLFWLLATLLWLFCFARGKPGLGVQPIIENTLLLPLMFVVYDLKPWLTGIVYISQTWSLSLEWYAYMLLPWFLLMPRAQVSLFLASFLIFSLAALNVIYPYNHGYHLIHGVFFIFIIGSHIYEENLTRDKPPVRTLTSFLIIVALGIVANAAMTLEHEWTSEVLVGLLAGIPLVYFLAKFPAHKADDLLGSLSYGVFLNHNLVLEIIYKQQVVTNHWMIFVLALAGSLPLAWASFQLVEKPFLQARRRWRRQWQATVP